MHNRTMAKAFPYIVTVEPSVDPLTLTEAKTYLRVSGTVDDALITMLIKAATAYAERHMKRDLITRTYKTLRDSFSDCLTLRRSPAQSIVSIKHTVGGVQETVSSSVYFLTIDNAFPSVELQDGQAFPTTTDNVPQSVEIIFKAGFGDAETDVPDDIRTALLQHVAALYSNRGDCTVDFVANAQQMLPTASRLVYDIRKIRDLRTC